MNREEIINSIVVFYQRIIGHVNGMVEAAKIMENSLLISKPKYQVGDKVKSIHDDKVKYEIEGRYYSPDEMKWYYTDFGDMIDHSEDELELVDIQDENR